MDFDKKILTVSVLEMAVVCGSSTFSEIKS